MSFMWQIVILGDPVGICVFILVSSVAQSCPTLCDSMNCSMPGLPVHQQLPKFTQTHVHWVGDAIQLYHPLSSPSTPALNLSQHQGLFEWVSSHITWPKYWSFIFNISPSNEHLGLISFRMDWLDLLAVQGTLKTKSNDSSVLNFLYSPTLISIHDYWKTIALTRWTFTGKVMSLLFNMLSRFVTTFLPRSKRLLISWLQSLSAVILEPRKIVSNCFHYFPIYLPWSDGTRCHDLRFLNVDF